MTTNFSGTNSDLSEEAEEGLFGDLVDLEAVPEEAEEPDPVETEAPEAPEAPEETEPVETPEAPTEEEAEEEPVVEAEVDWEQRFKDTQAQETRHFQQLREERERASQLEAELNAAYQAQLAAGPGVDVNALAAQAEAAGIDAEQIPFFVTLAQQVAASQVAPLQSQAAEAQARYDAQVMATQQVATARAIEDFRASKADITPEIETDMVAWLAQVGALEQRGDGSIGPVEPLTPDVLDIAFEAVNNPELGTYILNHPELYETDEGVQEARVLASVIAGSSTTQAPALRSTRDAVAAVDAAATLGGPSAPAIEEAEELFVKPSSTTFFSK